MADRYSITTEAAADPERWSQELNVILSSIDDRLRRTNERSLLPFTVTVSTASALSSTQWPRFRVPDGYRPFGLTILDFHLKSAPTSVQNIVPFPEWTFGDDGASVVVLQVNNLAVSSVYDITFGVHCDG
jgi:hypothetical protein